MKPRNKKLAGVIFELGLILGVVGHALFMISVSQLRKVVETPFLA